MIEFLRGVVQFKQNDHAVVEVNGVGYGLELTSGAAALLPQPGQVVELHVFLYVQEAVMRLYGFASRQERELFEIFLSTSGIGPRTAVNILSNIEIPVFARALLEGDLRTLTQVPGIGRKTAERLAIELRDKLQQYAAEPVAPKNAPGDETASALPPGHSPSQVLTDAIEALMSLGCKPLVAERAVLKAAEILGPEAGTPELVKEGLKHRR